MNILTEIESIYEQEVVGIDPSNVINCIYDPTSINRGRFTNKTSRYPDSLIKDYRRVQPYQPTPEFIKKLSNKIQFVKISSFERSLSLLNTINDYTMDEWVIHSDSDNIVLILPDTITDLLYGDVLTPLGILGIMLQRHYGDTHFKERIEEIYLKDNFICIGHDIYVNKDRSNLIGIADEVVDQLDNNLLPISTDIFKWR